jgi:hypothetical protein
MGGSRKDSIEIRKKYTEILNFKIKNIVKPVLNGNSRVQNIFPLKPGFRLIKV